jgi:hypothetical protein
MWLETFEEEVRWYLEEDIGHKENDEAVVVLESRQM